MVVRCHDLTLQRWFRTVLSFLGQRCPLGATPRYSRCPRRCKPATDLLLLVYAELHVQKGQAMRERLMIATGLKYRC
jgi:hypothetical protein